MRRLKFIIYLVILIDLLFNNRVVAGWLDPLYTSDFSLLTQFQNGIENSLISIPMVALTPTVKSVNVLFPNSYASVPDILIYIVYISVQKTTLQGFKVLSKNPSTTGFTIEYSTTTPGMTIAIAVQWIAYEKSSFAEVHQIDFTTTALQSSFTAASASDSVAVSFTNAYSDIPNVSLFLLGVTSMATSLDSINLATSTQLGGTNVSFSILNNSLVSNVAIIAFVSKKGMCITSPGSYTTLVSGVINSALPWQNISLTNRQQTMTQANTDPIESQNASNSLLTTASGLKGFEISLNIFLNLNIVSSSFMKETFQQTIETWGICQVQSGYWDSFICQTNSSTQEQLRYIEITWWMYLVASILLLLLIIGMYFCCCRKSNTTQQQVQPIQEFNKPSNQVNGLHNKVVLNDIKHYEQNDISELQEKSFMHFVINPFDQTKTITNTDHPNEITEKPNNPYKFKDMERQIQKQNTGVNNSMENSVRNNYKHIDDFNLKSNSITNDYYATNQKQSFYNQ